MTDTTEQLVHTGVDAGILTLTLDSPRNRNALGTTLVGQLLDGLDTARTDPKVRAVVLTHTGTTFCAGADLSEALARGASVAEATAEGTGRMLALMRGIVELPKPVIVAVNGHVRAGGFGLVGAADIAFGGPDTTFALTEARLGLAPAVISLVLLPKISARAAGRYFITGEKFSSDEAARMGLLTAAAASADELKEAVAAVIAGIGKGSPQGLAATKALTTAAILDDFDRHSAALAETSARLFASDEAREGMMAFLSKQRPSWDLT